MSDLFSSISATLSALWPAVISVGALAAFFGALLGLASARLKVETDPIVDRIDALLPQTQCGQCSFAGCRPYAEAIAAGEADINRCPPGGESTLRALADLLDREPTPLEQEEKPPAVAVIDESRCIGCTLCIQACPVDAILGAAKHMHTVIRDECTGCELCLPPCPVDCIEMRPLAITPDTWRWSPPQAPSHPGHTVASSPSPAAKPLAESQAEPVRRVAKSDNAAYTRASDLDTCTADGRNERTAIRSLAAQTSGTMTSISAPPASDREIRA